MTKLTPQIRQDLKTFLKSRLESGGVLAKISAPYKLADSEVELIKAQFPQLAKAQIVTTIDPSLIGGFVIDFGSQVIDCSIKSRLQTIL